MTNIPDWLSLSLTLIVMLIGLVGVILPVLPGLPLIWLGVLGYVLLEGFGGWGGGLAFGLITLLMLAGIAAEWLMGHAAAKASGASWPAVLASAGLGLIGLFVFPPVGAIVGAVLGMFLVEYLRHGRNAARAWTVLKGYARGVGWSVLVEFSLAVGMIMVWVWWVVVRGLGS